MKRIEKIWGVLRSRALTIWLLGLFIIYYISVAVWSQEAFAHLIDNLAHNVFFQAVYVLLAINMSIRIVLRLKRIWPEKFVFFFRLPLYAGLFVLLVSFFLSLNIRKNVWLLIGEGDVMGVPWENAQWRVTAIRSALQKDELRMEDSLIFSSEPGVVLLDEKGIYHTVGAFPPRLIGSNYMHILNFGIGPEVELREKGAAITRASIALRLTPFGSVDKFELQPFPYTFYVSILPSRIVKKGRETAQEYDLDKPKYRIEIVKGDRTIARGETDDQISFDGSMSLRLHQPSDWVLLDVSYDPFLPLFVAGLVMTGVGMVVYPLSSMRKWKCQAESLP